MFQLIVAVVSILLIAVLSFSAFWFGGDVFAESASKRHLIEFRNMGGAIEAGLLLYVQEKGFAPTETNAALLQTLADGGYLKSIPQGDWLVSNDYVLLYFTDENQCEALNKADGKDTSVTKCPVCTDPGFKDWPACSVPPT